MPSPDTPIVSYILRVDGSIEWELVRSDHIFHISIMDHEDLDVSIR